MQAGDLADGPLADILRTLAAAGATGGLHVLRRDPAGETESTRDAVLYLREGRLYAATSPGPRPLLGVRLVSAGAVTRAALEEALESQAGELAGWRLGELLVHLGYVDAEIVTEFVIEQIFDTVAEVSSWPSGSWRFRRGEKTREADDLALDIDEVLSRVSERLAHWSNLAAWGSRADAVPVRISFDPEVEAHQMPLAQTLLREIDGQRPLAELAVRCGLTTFEAGQVLALLVESGAVRAGAVAAAAPTSPDVPVAEPTSPDLPVATAPDDVPLPVDMATSATDAIPTAEMAPAPLAPAAWAQPAYAGTEVVTDAVADVAPADVPPAAPPAPPADDDLSALLGAAEDDLGLQLAILARQAEEARFAAEERRHNEVLAHRLGTTAEAAPIAINPAPVEAIVVAPLEPGQPAVAPVVPPLVPAVEPTEPSADLAPLTDPALSAPAQESSDLTEPTEAIEAIEAPVAEAPPVYQRILVEPLPGRWREPEVETVDQDETVPLDVAATEPAAAEPAAAEPAAAELEVLAIEAPEIAVAEIAAPEIAVPDFAVAIDEPDLASWAAALADEPTATPAAVVAPPPPSAPPVWESPLVEAIGQIGAEVASDDVQESEPIGLHERAAIQAALSEVALTTFAEPTPEPTPEPAPEPEPEPAHAGGPDNGWHAQQDDFTPAGESPFADTASLLRELSSLGLDDTPQSAPAPRAPAPRPTAGGTATAAKTKRKSIFGR
jgi:hypothetical protein